jgi:predicted O-methyltransferase YrrM
MLSNLIAASAMLVALYLLYKLRAVHVLLYEVHDTTRTESAKNFRQLEALLGLYIELDLAGSLPATRGWAASPDFLLELATHALSCRPACIVECSSGTSTLVLARCAQRNGYGKVFSLEHDQHYAEQTRQQLLRHGLSAWAEVIDAPLHQYQLDGEEWPWYRHEQLAHDAVIDMLVIDGPPQATRSMARYPAGPLLFPRLNAGAAVFLDDAARPDELAALQRWQAEFPQLVQSSRACEKGCTVLASAAFVGKAQA